MTCPLSPIAASRDRPALVRSAIRGAEKSEPQEGEGHRSQSPENKLPGQGQSGRKARPTRESRMAPSPNQKMEKLRDEQLGE